MKAQRALIAATAAISLLLTWHTASGQEIVPGDPLEKVLAVLGRPRGHIESGSFALYTYDRGRVELHDGFVAYAALVSEEKALARRQEEAERRERRSLYERDQEERRRVEGERILDETLGDLSFTTLPADQQLAFWRSFRRRYPEVDCSLPYAEAHNDHVAALERDRLRERVVELEQRTARAEADARQAKDQARKSSVRWSSPWYAPVRTYHPCRPVSVKPEVTYAPQPKLQYVTHRSYYTVDADRSLCSRSKARSNRLPSAHLFPVRNRRHRW